MADIWEDLKGDYRKAYWLRPVFSSCQGFAIWNWLFSSTGQIYFQSGKYSYFKATSCIFLLRRKVTQEYTLFIALAFIHVCSKAFVTVINTWGAGLVSDEFVLSKKPVLELYLCPQFTLFSDSVWTLPFWPKVAQWMNEGICVEINSCGFYKQLTWFPSKLPPLLLILNFIWGSG